MLSALITTHIPSRLIGLSAPKVVAEPAPASSPFRADSPVPTSQTVMESGQITPMAPIFNNENTPFALVNSHGIHMQHSGLKDTSITVTGDQI